MRATVTVQPDVNLLALHRMLAENGLYLVKVHNRRIVEMARVPRGMNPVEIVAEMDDNGHGPDKHPQCTD